MLGNMRCKATVSATKEQARKETLSTKTVNSDYGVNMIDESVQRFRMLRINSMRWNMPFQ
jgi:hypothetical protein